MAKPNYWNDAADLMDYRIIVMFMRFSLLHQICVLREQSRYCLHIHCDGLVASVC